MAGDVSFVVITKDLEWNIERILDSIHAAVPDPYEVVLVDSASTDRTVEIALAYPRDVTVCVLSPEQRLTAAAGRYVGQMETTGDYIAFLDGDTELLPGFIDQARDVLEGDPSVGAVGGVLKNIARDADASPSSMGVGRDDSVSDVFSVSGGTMLARRSALEAAGSFSVRVFSDEEPALCVRLRHAGFRVVRIDRVASFHRTDPDDEIVTLLRRRRRGLWIGHGQNIREFRGTGMLGEYLRERGHGILPALYVVVVVISLAFSLLTRNWRWTGLVGAASLLGFGVLAVAKRSLHSAAYSVVKRFIMLEGTIRGLRDSSVPAERIDLDYEVVA
jgi:glycosyltransferase involved in cell wall biosynthesis